MGSGLGWGTNAVGVGVDIGTMVLVSFCLVTTSDTFFCCTWVEIGRLATTITLSRHSTRAAHKRDRIRRLRYQRTGTIRRRSCN